MSAALAYASDFSAITFEMTDGSSASISIANLVMTVENGSIVAVSGDSQVDIPLDKLAKFRFSNNPTGVESVEIDYNTPVEVFDTTGKTLGSFDNVKAAVSSLPAGIYVMKSNSQTFKTVVK